MQALQSWEHDPEAGLFLLNQGQQSYLSSQNIEESLDWYSLSLLIDGDSGENYLWRGIALMDLGDTDQAMVDFHAAIVHGLGEYYYGVPVQAMAWANLGCLLLDRGKLAEAIYAFEQASALAPDVDDFRIQLHDIQKLLELME
jgi:tetratricopeptide (TPR) repeat protein